MSRRMLVVMLVAVLSWGLQATSVHAQKEEAETRVNDPWEPFNQSMFTFNLKLDDYILHPVASAYNSVVPADAQRGVQRFFKNLGVVERVANNLFQGKLSSAGQEVGRFLVNTTIGCAGFLDVAEPTFGWRESPEDFGQTLAVYGVANGPYLVLPFFGPSTVRDTAGLVVDGALNPMNYLLPAWQVLAIKGGSTVVSAVNYRAMNLDLFADVQRSAVDLYGAAQDGYIQRREKAIQE